jgi:hypothetical protein
MIGTHINTQSNDPILGLQILPHREVRTSLNLLTETQYHNLEYQPKQNSEAVDRPSASREVTYTLTVYITLPVQAVGEGRGRRA